MTRILKPSPFQKNYDGNTRASLPSPAQQRALATVERKTSGEGSTPLLGREGVLIRPVRSVPAELKAGKVPCRGGIGETDLSRISKAAHRAGLKAVYLFGCEPRECKAS